MVDMKEKTCITIHIWTQKILNVFYQKQKVFRTKTNKAKIYSSSLDRGVSVLFMDKIIINSFYSSKIG